jgi:regulator of cell morphogenesis and NO signaling
MATPQSTVGDIALEHPASVRVFEKLGIDYCCGGSKPLAEACREHSLDVKTVIAELDDAGKEIRRKDPDWAAEPLEFICQHIVETHHAYILTEMPRLSSLARKVVLRHSDAHPELNQIQELIEALAVELLLHLHKEEMVLFPFVTNMERNIANRGLRSLECFGAVRNPIHVMMDEHNTVSVTMAEIRTLSHTFAPPEDACPTWRSFYRALAEFDSDLNRHVHLENDVLFPRAIEMDESWG